MPAGEECNSPFYFPEVKVKWFRVYNEITTDPKFRILGRSNSWILTQLLAYINEYFRDSGKISIEELQTFCSIVGTTFPKCMKIIEKCIELEMVNKQGNFYHLTNWHRRQFESDSSAGRTRKWRERKSNCDATVTATVTAPETETDSETDPEKKSRDSEESLSLRKYTHESKPSSTPRCPYEGIRKLFNFTCSPPLDTVHELTSTEKNRIQVRWKADPRIEVFEKQFAEVNDGPWLLGENPNGWQATLLWIMRRENWDKIKSGEYRLRKWQKKPGPAAGKSTEDHLNDLEVT